MLSSICEHLGWPLFVVDTEPRCIEYTERVLDHAGDRSNRQFFTGTFQALIESALFDVPLNTVFIDGSHYYDDVKADTETLYHLPILPFNAALHDYSLRNNKRELLQPGVDRAIHEVWGGDAPLIRIGRQYGPGAPVMSAAGSYYAPNGSEDVFLELEKTRPNRSAIRSRAEVSNRNKYPLPADFNRKQYLALNPDVARAGYGFDAVKQAFDEPVPVNFRVVLGTDQDDAS